MEKRIKQRFNATILSEAAQRYAVQADQLRSLDGFESFLFEYERGGQSYILRLGHSLRRSAALIQAEVDWINYLAQSGAGVARAVLSADGQLVEKLPDGHGAAFLATAFVKAPGHAPRKEDWNPDLYERYGRLLGRMHALAKHYQPRPGAQRLQWNDPSFSWVEDLLPEGEQCAKAHYRALLEHLATLPRDIDSYGLIHQDAHGGNFFVDEQGRITLFDFDDCLYSWYINDIAIVLFYMVMWKPDPAAFARAFLTDFLRGYRQENQLDPAWLAETPSFLKLREIELYAVIHRSFTPQEMNDDAWVKGYMAGRKARIEAGRPYLDLDFTLFSNEMR